MNKIKSKLINYIVITSFLFCSSPSFSMMTCVGNGFDYDESRNGTILCRSPNLTCSYKPQSEWDWWATGITYSVASAVCGVVLDRIINYFYPAQKIDNIYQANQIFEKTLDSDSEIGEETHLKKTKNKSL